MWRAFTLKVTSPRSVNFTAFPSRLISTCRSLPSSPLTKISRPSPSWPQSSTFQLNPFCLQRKLNIAERSLINSPRSKPTE